MAVKAPNLDNRIARQEAPQAGSVQTQSPVDPVSTAKVLADWSGGQPDRATVVLNRRFVVRLTRLDGNGSFAAACNCREECCHPEEAIDFFQFYAAHRERSRAPRATTNAISAPRAEGAHWTDGDDGLEDRPYDGPARDVAEADVLPAAVPAYAFDGVGVEAPEVWKSDLDVAQGFAGSEVAGAIGEWQKRHSPTVGLSVKPDRGPVWGMRCPAVAYDSHGVRLPYAEAHFALLIAEALHVEIDRRADPLVPSRLVGLEGFCQIMPDRYGMLASHRDDSGYWVARPPFTADSNLRGGTWHAPDVLLKLAYAGSWELKYGGIGGRADFIPLDISSDEEDEVAS